MGNAQVTVGLRTEKQTYKAGDRVSGTVYVNVDRRAHPAQAIALRILGREHSLVHHTTSETRREGHDEQTHHRDHYDESTSDFLHVEYPLQSFATGRLLPGQYEFPFNITLPSNLPSSMSCRQGESHCSVEYLLTATLVKPSSGIGSLHPNAEQKLSIMAIPPPGEHLEDSSLLLPVDEVPVYSCCCHNKGSMILQTQFSKTTVQHQDTIDVQFRCSNQSTIQVKTVRIQLEEITEWTAHNRGRSEVVKRILDRREMDASQFPELAKRHKRRQRDYFGVPPDHEHGSDQWRHASIHIPFSARDTYNGQVVKVRHLVSVQLITKGCCNTHPDATTSVQVYQSIPSRSGTASTVPSAPSSLYDEYSAAAMVSTEPTATAPPSHWDDDAVSHSTWNNHVPMTSSAPSELYDGIAAATATAPLPTAEAQLLPSDWNAQTAEVVTIPMAEAIVLDPPPSPWNVTSFK